MKNRAKKKPNNNNKKENKKENLKLESKQAIANIILNG